MCLLALIFDYFSFDEIIKMKQNLVDFIKMNLINRSKICQTEKEAKTLECLKICGTQKRRKVSDK